MFFLLLAVLSVLPAWADEPTPMSFDDMELMDEPAPEAAAAARAKRSENIEFLGEILSKGESEGANKADLMLRLAHLYHEHGRAERDPDTLRKAVRLYQQILESFPDFVAADRVLFYLGFAKASLGDPDAAAVLARMVQAYPASTYVPHATLHLGEQLFAREQYDAARASYAASAGYDYEFTDFAAYKLAWADKRLGDDKAALDRMVEVVRTARPGLASVAADTARYWAAELGLADQVASVLHASPHRTGTCLDELDVLRRRIEAHPMAAEALDAQLEVMACLRQTGQTGALPGETRKLDARFGKKSPWYDRQDRATQRRAREAVKAAHAAL